MQVRALEAQLEGLDGARRGQAPQTGVDGVRVCGGCGVEEAHAGDYQKCGRCLAVYYCCTEHQRLHWPEHQKICRPAEEPTP